jgi:hypothetical protein
MINRTTLWRRKKLRPGVLQKFREGIARPTVIDDIAGVKLSNVQATSVTPRYVDYHTGLGPLVFHHMNYSGGARWPHRPIVLRRAFRATRALQWASRLGRFAQDALEDVQRRGQPRWLTLPVDEHTDIVPNLAFTVGTLLEAEVLVACGRTASHSTGSTSSPARQPRRVAHEGDEVVEPWRLGIGLDPHIRATQRTFVECVRGLGVQRVGPKVDMFLLPWEALVLDVTVPDETMEMCRAANVERTRKQYAAGLRAMSDVDNSASSVGSFGLSSSRSTIRAEFGDVIFLPSMFSFAISRPVGYDVQELVPSAAISSEGDMHMSAIPKGESASVICTALKFVKYPRLSEAQSRLYIPADYTVGSKLDEFYAKGGNSLSPQYV